MPTGSLSDRLLRARTAWSAGAPPVTRRQARWLAGIVVVGALLRIAWVTYAARHPQTLIDPTFYSLYAERIADGHGYTLSYGEPTAYYPPGYPIALGVVVWFVRALPGVPYHLPTVAGWFNIVLGVATIGLVFELGRRVFDDTRIGLVGAAILALWPNLIFHTAVALTETLFNFLLLAALLVLLVPRWDGEARPSTRRLVVFGLLLGASVLVRPISLLVLPGLGLVWLRRLGWDWRAVLGRLAIAGATTAAVILPWTVRNAFAMDAFVPISTNFGDNLCIGRHEGATGAFSLTTECFGGYDHLKRPEYETERNSGTTREAIDYLVHHPVDEVRLLWWRAFYTLHDDHDALAVAESYGADRFMSKRWRNVWEWTADAWFFGVLGLTVVGLTAVRRRDDARRSFFLWSMVAMAVPPLIFFGDVRFHVPVLPFMAVIAAVTVVRVRDAAR